MNTRCILFLYIIIAISCNMKKNPLLFKRVEVDENGKSIKEYYMDNKNHIQGLYKEYYPNRNLIVLYRYKNGSLEGEQRQYYPDAKLQSIGYCKNGMVDSSQKCYYENGTIKSINFRLKGQLFGSQKDYYENGHIQGNYFMMNDSIEIFNFDFDTSGKLVNKIKSFICYIYEKDKLSKGDSVKVVFYTIIPENFNYIAELIQKNGKRISREYQPLADFNNNKGLLFVQKIETMGKYEVGLRVQITNPINHISFLDSLFFAYSVH
jgi:antitoxin component YwqK of YwqJK toxin-antitoxin module